MKVGILCENYFPTLGGEQEHIFNLRRHLETPADGSAPVDVRIIVPHVAHGAWLGPKDDDRVLRPAHSLRIHGEGSASQITITPSAYGALKRIFARERFELGMVGIERGPVRRSRGRAAERRSSRVHDR